MKNKTTKPSKKPKRNHPIPLYLSQAPSSGLRHTDYVSVHWVTPKKVKLSSPLLTPCFHGQYLLPSPIYLATFFLLSYPNTYPGTKSTNTKKLLWALFSARPQFGCFTPITQLKTNLRSLSIKVSLHWISWMKKYSWY